MCASRLELGRVLGSVRIYRVVQYSAVAVAVTRGVDTIYSVQSITFVGSVGRNGRVGKPLLVMVDRRFDMRLNMGWVVPLFSRYHREMLYINGAYTTLGQVVYSNPGFSPSEVGIVCEG